MRSRTLKALALGGIVGPILFTSVTIASAYLRPEYEHLHNFISELGATNTTNDALMNYVGFILCGLLFVCFAISLLKIVSKVFIAKLGAFLILIFGIGMLMAGIFSCDPGCPTVGSLEATIHDRVSASTFLSAIIGMVLLGISFRKSILYKSISVYSILSGLVSAILLLIMINTFESRVFTGLWQRLLLLTIFLWTTIVALRYYKANTD